LCRECSLHDGDAVETWNAVFGKEGEMCLRPSMPRLTSNREGVHENLNLLRLRRGRASERLGRSQLKKRLRNDDPHTITWKFDVANRQIDSFDMDHDNPYLLHFRSSASILPGST